MTLVIQVMLLAALLTKTESQVMNSTPYKQPRQENADDSSHLETKVAYQGTNDDDIYNDTNSSGDDNIEYNYSGDYNQTVDETIYSDLNQSTNEKSKLYQENEFLEVTPSDHNSRIKGMKLDDIVFRRTPAPETNLKLQSVTNNEQTLNLIGLNSDNTNETTTSETTSESTTEYSETIERYSISNLTIFDRKTLPRCPDGLNYYRSAFGRISICYFITEPTTFPPKCPYLNNIEYYFLNSQFLVNILNESVWAFATRNKSEGSGVFEWTTYVHFITNQNYIAENEYIRDQDDMTEKDCMIINQYQLVQESCTEKHPGICAYSYDSYFPSFNDYCRRRYNSSCVRSDMGSLTKCFCKSDIGSYDLPRKVFCKNLAQLTSPYQNNLLTERFVLDEPCWIGLDNIESNIRQFQWSSTNSTTNYTYFSNRTDYANPYGALAYDGWTLQNDGAVNCAICEIDVLDHAKVQLNLSYNETTNVIELEISNATEVYQGVICFANNITKFINLTTNIHSVIVQNVWNSFPYEYYWCKTWQLPNLTIVYSNTIFSNNPSTESTKSAHLSDSRGCLPSVTISGSVTLHWPATQFGVTAIPEELCLQEDGSPVTRACGGTLNFASGWLQVNGSCADVTFSARTLELNELLQTTDAMPVSLTSNLSHITEDNYNVTSFQIHLVSKVLDKVATSTQSVSRAEIKNVITTINNIMHYEPNKLRGAQELLNSTDIVLCSLDDILVRTDLGESGYAAEVSEKLLMQISNVKKTGITGIKLHPSGANGFDSQTIVPLSQGASQAEVVQDHLDLAVLTPEQLYNDIVNCAGSKTTPNIITAVFYDDTLFNEKDNVTGNTDGRIVSVVIPGFNCSFTAPLQVIFKKPDNDSEVKCASWVYGSNNYMESIHGHWSLESDPTGTTNSAYLMCEFRHITHFSLLVLGPNTNITEGHKKALDIITAVGSGLSLLGLLVIFLTAIIFKSYRSANGVVIHFSLAMTAQIVLLFIADNVAGNDIVCTVFGAALHYIVLSQFCWMLTIAVLQYQRYVVVIYTPPTHLVAKSCAFSWGLPLLPVIIIVSISTDNYGQNSYGLCYALGHYFIFGVLLPVSLIVFVNLLVFLRILISIASSRRIKVHQKKDDTSSLQLRLAFLLYFLLGLTWGFGLLAAIGGGIVYSYLFCLTATLQGFVMFLFFIVLNDRTRSLWTNMKTCCRKTEYEIGADSSATAMVRRARTTASTDTCTDSTSSEMLRRYKNRSSSDF